MTKKFKLHDAFTDRKGNKITRESYMAKKTGKAYGFFKCRASKDEIEAELPIIRDSAQTPSKLELSLIKGVDNLKGDERLRAIAQDVKKQGNNYVFEATYQGETNRKTAGELGDILNHMYLSQLYEKKEPFCGEVVFEENGKYLSID